MTGLATPGHDEGSFWLGLVRAAGTSDARRQYHQAEQRESCQGETERNPDDQQGRSSWRRRGHVDRRDLREREPDGGLAKARHFERVVEEPPLHRVAELHLRAGEK